jgi:L-threonylcarbamoyladenylate synthase
MKTFANLTLHAQDIAALLCDGAVAVLPTDTVIGLAACPMQSAAVDRLYALKARPRAKNLPIMIADAEALTELGAQISESAAAFLNSHFMPGPLTLVLPIEAQRAPSWLAGRTEVAVRIPDHDGLRDVLRKTGPLLVTSANLSGEEPRGSSAQAASHLTQFPDLCVEGSAQSDAPSTLIDCTVEPARVERVGAASVHDLAKIWTLA